MRDYKDFIRKDEIVDRKVELEVAPLIGCFSNNQFSNEAFKELSHMECFTSTSGGREFYFAYSDISLAIRKSSKEAFAEEAERLRKHFYEVAQFIAKNIDDTKKTYNNCKVCGYDEFETLYLRSSEGATSIVTSEDTGARIEFCKKCGTARVYTLRS